MTADVTADMIADHTASLLLTDGLAKWEHVLLLARRYQEMRARVAELEAERAKLEAVAMPEECPASTRKLIEFAVIFDTGYELSQSTITDMWFDIRNDIAKLAEPQPKVAP